VTLANKELDKLIEPFLEAKLNEYEVSHPSLTPEQREVVKTVLRSLINSQIFFKLPVKIVWKQHSLN
jgi:FixJ family two-component response regulator